MRSFSPCPIIGLIVVPDLSEGFLAGQLRTTREKKGKLITGGRDLHGSFSPVFSIFNWQVPAGTSSAGERVQSCQDRGSMEDVDVTNWVNNTKNYTVQT